jgi:hypothetical protein
MKRQSPEYNFVFENTSGKVVYTYFSDELLGFCRYLPDLDANVLNT